MLPNENIKVRDKNENFLPWFKMLLKITENFDLKTKYSEEFTDINKSNPILVDLKGDIENQFYNILLNKELKNALEYNQLHLKLNAETKNTSKHNKFSKI